MTHRERLPLRVMTSFGDFDVGIGDDEVDSQSEKEYAAFNLSIDTDTAFPLISSFNTLSILESTLKGPA
ncbi:hypothetical protein TNCV_3188381 [Trichonephila clavipes]|nr:hypothetical protein TNCV_3188381 [Trichonephila clavipes]